MSSATFNGNSRWADGTSVVVPGSPANAIKRQAFPGIDGVYELNEGRREMTIAQAGMLYAFDDPSPSVNLAALISAVDALSADAAGGTTGTLIDDYGRTFPECRMETFETGPVKRAVADGNQGYYCTYRISYLQSSGAGAS